MIDVNIIGGAARAIQLAIAPVFLLSAIAGFLNVLTNRLGRVIDRSRTLESKIEPPRHPGLRLFIPNWPHCRRGQS